MFANRYYNLAPARQSVQEAQNGGGAGMGPKQTTNQRPPEICPHPDGVAFDSLTLTKAATCWSSDFPPALGPYTARLPFGLSLPSVNAKGADHNGRCCLGVWGSARDDVYARQLCA